MEQTTPTSIMVVETVAEAEGVDPVALEPPLYDVIDTDALDALFRRSDGTRSDTIGTLEFTYRGHTVVVQGREDVHVRASRSQSQSQSAIESGANTELASD